MTNTAPKDPDFPTRSQDCLSSLQDAFDAFDPDELEADLAAGVLKITFKDGTHCVLNRQAAASQIWLAAGASAWHFAFDPAQDGWFDTKGRGELRAIVGEILSKKLARTIRI